MGVVQFPILIGIKNLRITGYIREPITHLVQGGSLYWGNVSHLPG